jgi:glutamate---cysteine ligase / carboxylate-amine ligase
MTASYQFGIEEELFLADAKTRGPPVEVEAFHSDVHAQMPEVERELLRAQVEIMTPPCTDFGAARDSLTRLRSGVAEIGRRYDMLLLASGTNPVAQWKRQRSTQKDRYQKIADELQMLARRDAVCGMHVHVEVPQPDRRVDLMNRFLPYTPVLLALSASSPFWEGEDTGLHAYRLSVWGEMPRTGLPEIFEDRDHFDRLVTALTRSGTIADASFLWWTLRPSIRFPTLEMRVADSCTRLEDTLTIAALYRCLIRLIDRSPALNSGLTSVSRAIVSENVWRAQRYGVHATFIDEEGGVTPFAQQLDSILETVAEDAQALGCESEVMRAREIVRTGTSADHQLRIAAGAHSDDGHNALHDVVDWIASQTNSQHQAP